MPTQEIKQVLLDALAMGLLRVCPGVMVDGALVCGRVADDDERVTGARRD